MTKLDVLTVPDPILREKAKPVEVVDDRIRKILDDMLQTMYEDDGIGLAANQVGTDQSIIIFDPQADKANKPYQVLINPEITSMTGEYLSENEGCLSVPDFRSDVKRAASVVVEGLSADGQPVRIEAENLLSIILQHEIDHLNGILFIDRISSLKRELYKRKIKKQQKQ